MRPPRRQGAGAHAAAHQDPERRPAGSRHRRCADARHRPHRRPFRDAHHQRRRRAGPGVHHRGTHRRGLLPRAERDGAGDRARTGLRAGRRPAVGRDEHPGPGGGPAVRRGHPQGLPGQDAGLQLLAVVQLAAPPRRRHDRAFPARARRHGLRVPVHHPGRIPRAQLLDVRPRTRLRSGRDERLRAASGSGVRGREPRLHRDPAPTRGRHRILRPGRHRDRPGRVDDGTRRLDGGRAVRRGPAATARAPEWAVSRSPRRSGPSPTS